MRNENYIDHLRVLWKSVSLELLLTQFDQELFGWRRVDAQNVRSYSFSSREIAEHSIKNACSSTRALKR